MARGALQVTQFLLLALLCTLPCDEPRRPALHARMESHRAGVKCTGRNVASDADSARGVLVRERGL